MPGCCMTAQAAVAWALTGFVLPPLQRLVHRDLAQIRLLAGGPHLAPGTATLNPKPYLAPGAGTNWLRSCPAGESAAREVPAGAGG